MADAFGINSGGSSTTTRKKKYETVDKYVFTMLIGIGFGLSHLMFIQLFYNSTYILAGPFIFYPVSYSNYMYDNKSDAVFYGLLVAFFNSLLFIFVVYVYNSRRFCDCASICLFKQFNVLDSLKKYYLQYQLTNEQMQTLLVTQDIDIMAKLDLNMKKLRLELIAFVIGMCMCVCVYVCVCFVLFLKGSISLAACQKNVSFLSFVF